MRTTQEFVGGVTVLLASLVLAAFAAAADTGERKITVVFRFDDVSPTSPLTLETRILNAFRSRRVPLSVGVIPFPRSPGRQSGSPNSPPTMPVAKVELLRSPPDAPGLIEVALHGYTHESLTGDSARPSEFAGASFEEQLRWIVEGNKLLRQSVGQAATTFIPPWNRYDLETLRALRQTGFACLSADPDGPMLKSCSLTLLPRTCPQPMQLRRAILAARQCDDPEPVIVLVFHLYDFVENDAKLGVMRVTDLEAILDWIREQRDLKMRTIHQAAQSKDHLGIGRYLAYQDYLRRQLRLRGLVRVHAYGVYHSAAYSRKLAGQLRLLTWMFFGVAPAVVTGLAWLGSACVLRRWPNWRRGLLYVVAPCAAVGTVAAWTFLLPAGQRTAMAACLIGLCLGVLLGVWLGVRGNRSGSPTPAALPPQLDA